MPRFFFDLDEDGLLTSDREGLEMDGPDEARRAALTTLPEMARDLSPNSDACDIVATVRDETGALFRVALSIRCERL